VPAVALSLSPPSYRSSDACVVSRTFVIYGHVEPFATTENMPRSTNRFVSVVQRCA